MRCFTYVNGQWNVESFPIQTQTKTVPLVVAEEAYKEYAEQHGTEQSLTRLGERGGFGAAELAILLFDRIKRLEHNSQDERLGDLT